MSAQCMTVLALAGTIALAPSGLSQSGLTPPRIGFVRDGAGNVRPLFGISGNFWRGEKVATDGVSVASSSSFSILKRRAPSSFTTRSGVSSAAPRQQPDRLSSPSHRLALPLSHGSRIPASCFGGTARDSSPRP